MPETPAQSRPRSTPGGGFVVHRRGDSTGRIMTPPHRQMFEHASLEEACEEASRLAARHNREFVVFAQVASIPAPAVEAVQAEEAA